MSTHIDSEELGRRIRKLRGDMRMTLKQVEHISGLSATHLSEIERGRTSPTIGALIRIARAMEKDASFFLENDERADVGQLLREQVTTLEGFASSRVEVLSPGIPGGMLSAYRVQMPPGAAQILQASRHELPRDVIYHVHSGSIAVEIRGSEIVLEAGDTLQATLGEPIRVAPKGDTAADFHMVTTEPLEAQS